MVLAINDVIGTAGNDVLSGTAGADNFIGNGGVDKVSYSQSATGVVASLFINAGTGGEAMGDIYNGIRNILGSKFDDVLTGNVADNLLQGGAGRDRLNGRNGDDVLSGGAGNDILVGGGGADINSGGAGDRDAVDFSRSKSAIALDLELGEGWLGDAEGDTFIDIEFIYGTAFDDEITGDTNINRLIGNAGNDMIDGGGGNDYILAGTGNDTMTGGEGKDVFVIEAGFEQDTITDFEAGKGYTDRIWLQGVGLGDFGEVLANAVDSAAGVIITAAGHGTLTLQNVNMAQLVADDFLFA